MRVLCTGDLHLGRRSSRIPSHLDGPRYSCSAAWDAVVDCAIEQRVDLVAISGDLVDRENRYFEAFGPLERGLRRLAEAGIVTVAVAGNHDFDVLPHLTESLDPGHFRLLGRGGEWERFTLERDGRPALHVDGWSFPDEHVTRHPLDAYGFPHDDAVPTLAILHADLDQPQSRYCPVALADLRRFPVALWLLGHIHRADLLAGAGGPPVLYPGSPQAMDPGEIGAHGPWIVELGPGAELRPRQICTSTVRYEPVEVDLSGADAEAEAERRVLEAIRDALDRVVDGEDRRSLECLCCRLTVTGRTRLHRHLPALLDPLREDLRPSSGRVTAVVEKIVYATRPAADLTELAKLNDPPGELARLLLALESDRGLEGYEDLVRCVSDRLREVHRSRHYQVIGADPEPDTAFALQHLREAGLALLDALLAQKETA